MVASSNCFQTHHVRTDLFIYSTKVITLLCGRHRITDLEGGIFTLSPALHELNLPRKSSPPLLQGWGGGVGAGRLLSHLHSLTLRSPGIQGCTVRWGTGFSKLHVSIGTLVPSVVKWGLLFHLAECRETDPSTEIGSSQINTLCLLPDGKLRLLLIWQDW